MLLNSTAWQLPITKAQLPNHLALTWIQYKGWRDYRHLVQFLAFTQDPSGLGHDEDRSISLINKELEDYFVVRSLQWSIQ